MNMSVTVRSILLKQSRTIRFTRLRLPILQQRTYSSSIFKGARSYFLGLGRRLQSEEDYDENPVDELIPYVNYPLFTTEQLKKIATDKFKLEVGHASFGYHSDSIVPSINSLSDLTDPTQLNSLLPRRRP